MSAIPRHLNSEPIETTRQIQGTQSEYQPRTALGKKLVALRRAYIENGGTLLDEAAFQAELRSRRGGVNA